MSGNGAEQSGPPSGHNGDGSRPGTRPSGVGSRAGTRPGDEVPRGDGNGAGLARGWAVVASYSAVAGASQLLWLTYAPVTTAAAQHYGVSVTAIGWLANVFPLLYVLLAVPAGLALDRWPRAALAAGALLTALGGVVRLGGDSFGWALAGQLMVAVAQPLVLNAITGVVGVLPYDHVRPASLSARQGSSSAWCWLSALEPSSVATILWRSRPVRRCWRCSSRSCSWSSSAARLRRRRPSRCGRGRRPARGVDRRDPAAHRVARLPGLRGVRRADHLAAGAAGAAGISESAAGAIITVAVAVGAVGSTAVSAVLEGRASR